MSGSSGLDLAQQILGARMIPEESDPVAPVMSNQEPTPSPSPAPPTGFHSSFSPSASSDNTDPFGQSTETETPTTPSTPVKRTPPATVNGFRDEYFFLSNFAPSPVYINFQGVVVLLPTGEHVFHAMKVAAMLDRSPQAMLDFVVQMTKAATPGQAKKLGRTVRIDPARWDSLSIGCMKRTVELKFSQNPDLRKALLATGKSSLVEENDWGDRLWGTVNGQGRNELGKALMAYRDNILNR